MPKQLKTHTNKTHNNAGNPGDEKVPPPTAARSQPTFAERVSRMFQEGEILCDKPAHYTKGTVVITDAEDRPILTADGATRYRPVCHPVLRQEGGWKRILGMMMPGDVARCACERSACEAAWKPHAQSHVLYGSRYVERGTYRVGIEGVGARQLFVTELQLTKELKDKLAAAHPSYYFVGGTEFHTHPFMHITTQIASRSLFARLAHLASLREDKSKAFQITDLHGNPRSNARTNKNNQALHIDTIVEPSTPEDMIRLRNKWFGAPYSVSSLRSCGTAYDPATKMEVQDAITGIHTGYYYDRKEVRDCAALLPPSSSFWMVMHKFPLAPGVTKGSPEDTGTFGHGEVRWTRHLSDRKDNAGKPIYLIRQYDEGSGVPKYTHNDNSHWFEASSWYDGARTLDSEGKECWAPGIAWDINAAGPDTFLIQVASCPGNLCWTAEQFAAAAEASVPVYKSPRSAAEHTGVVAPGMRISSPKSYMDAKDSLCGVVERDHKRWGEHVARYRRLMAKHKETEQDLHAVALHCFFADVKGNREQQIVAFSQHRAGELRAKRLTASKHDPSDWGATMGRTLLFGAAILSVARSPPEKIAAEMLGHTAGLVRDYV